MKSKISSYSPAVCAGLHRVDFHFESRPVQCVTINARPWFAAGHVCAVLGLSNPSEALRSLDPDEKITLSNPDGNPRKGIPHRSIYVNESGLYGLIFKSRKPRAKLFKRWVCSEVLPTLRATGRYEARPSPDDQQAAWLVGQIARVMPWARLLDLLYPIHEFGSIASNGQPRKGFRRAAFVAAGDRPAAARDFHERVIVLRYLLKQLELPLEGRAA